MTETTTRYGRLVTLSVKMQESLRQELKIISAMEEKTMNRIIIGLISDFVNSKRRERQL